ncbi:MAG: GNAT family N-acetyltransferase [Tissierellia bacterium]|nr:GNAT family N-acetyltransferase [Tissierellia bacterium]
MNIKRAKRTYLKTLLSIDRSSFPPQEITPKETFIYRIQNFPQWFFVAEENDKILGFISCRPCNGEIIQDEFFSTNKIPESTTLAILNLAISTEWREKGIGTRLLEHILTLADTRGYSKVIVSCKKELIPYFSKHGFTPNGMSHSRTLIPHHNMIRRR